MLHLNQLALHSAAVTAATTVAPAHHRAICQHSSKGVAGCVDLPNIPQHFLDRGTVATGTSIAPGHDGPIAAHCSESVVRRVNLRNIFQLGLESDTITALVRTSPRHHRAVALQQRESCMSGCELGVADDGADCVSITKASCFELDSSSGLSVSRPKIFVFWLQSGWVRTTACM